MYRTEKLRGDETKDMKGMKTERGEWRGKKGDARMRRRKKALVMYCVKDMDMMNLSVTIKSPLQLTTPRTTKVIQIFLFCLFCVVKNIKFRFRSLHDNLQLSTINP